MPLFESQKGRDERLFKEILGAYLEALPAFIADLHERVVHTAWVMGGALAANTAVRHCKSLKEAWGKGDERKACMLTELFTLAMISEWYRRLDKTEERSQRERREARRIAASNVLTVFEDHSVDAVEDYLKWDAQFSYDEDRRDQTDREGIPLVSFALLCSQAEQACRGSNVDLNQVTLPVNDLASLRRQGVDLIGDVVDIMQTGVVLNLGAISMFQWYDTRSKWL